MSPAPTATEARRLGFSRLSPRWLAAGAFVIVGALAVTAHQLGPQPPAWYPPCVVHHVTGLHCPGCGSGRAVHALAHGDLPRAMDQNGLLLVMLAPLTLWAGVALWRGLRHDRPPLPFPTGTARIVLIAVVVFTLARNLPWWPLTLLAPG